MNDVIQSDTKKKHHEMLLNYPAASRKAHVGQGFSKFQWLSQISCADCQETQCTNTISQGFLWHLQEYSHLGSSKGKNHKDWGLCTVFCPGLATARCPSAPSSCALTYRLISHLTALLRKARRASAPAEKARKIFQRKYGKAAEGRFTDYEERKGKGPKKRKEREVWWHSSNS